MKITRLILIRHGLTLWNKSGKYCGCKDVALSKEGKAQARRLSNLLKDAKFDKVYSSDRKRALQTARIIFKQAKIVKAPLLREINFGVLEGLRHKEILLKYPDFYRKWIKDPYQNCIPQAESMNAFKKRVNLGIKKIVRKNSGKDLAIVCHGGVISILISTILKKKNFWKYVPKAASLTLVECRDGLLKLKKFNK